MNRREFNQLFAGIFAMLCGFKVTAAPEQDNTGYWPDRIIPIEGHPDWNVWEQSFAAVWEKQNEPSPGLNYGHGLLQDLMISTLKYENPFKSPSEVWVTDRERKIVAMVVQWLGTSCGRSFLYEVQREAQRRHGEAGKYFP